MSEVTAFLNYLFSSIRERKIYYMLAAVLYAGIAGMLSIYQVVKDRNTQMKIYAQEIDQENYARVSTRMNLVSLDGIIKEVNESIKTLGKSVDQKQNDLILLPAQKDREDALRELKILTSAIENLKKQVSQIEDVKTRLERIHRINGGSSASYDEQGFLGELISSAHAAPVENRNSTPSISPTPENIPMQYRGYVLMSVVAGIIALLFLLCLMCAWYIFTLKADADGKLAKHEEENRKVAIEILKGLIGVFTGLATGILVGR